jgi:ATP-dependent protease HslVU (ClpYQ) peptidase subunit
VGYIDKKTKKVTIGGDSASVADISITVRKDVKVFRNKDFIIGCTSSFRMAQLLRFSFKPPDIKSKDIYEYMCTNFINEVRNCFENGGYLQKYTDGDEKGGTFLVAYKNRLFKIYDDFQVAESVDIFDAVGCGADFALGSLFTVSSEKLAAKEKVIHALESASYFSGGVRPPFILIST